MMMIFFLQPAVFTKSISLCRQLEGLQWRIEEPIDIQSSLNKFLKYKKRSPMLIIRDDSQSDDNLRLF